MVNIPMILGTISISIIHPRSSRANPPVKLMIVGRRWNFLSGTFVNYQRQAVKLPASMWGYSMQKVSGRVYWRYWSMMILILFWSSLMTKTHHCWWLMLCQNFSTCKLSILWIPFFEVVYVIRTLGDDFDVSKESRTCRGEKEAPKNWLSWHVGFRRMEWTCNTMATGSWFNWCTLKTRMAMQNPHFQ